MKERSSAGKTPPIYKSGSLTIRELVSTQDGYTWTTYLVQGWRENGKWQRKKFKKLTEAKGFVALKAVELMNTDTSLATVVTSLTHAQMKEAEGAFLRLGGRYALAEVVEYYLKNHFDPENPKRLCDVIDDFIAAKTRELLKPRSLDILEDEIRRFNRYLEAVKAPELVLVHDISAADIAGFLGTLKAKDGVSPAKAKTYNNLRSSISSFFSWACNPANGLNMVNTNPVESVPHFSNRKVKEQRPEVEVMTPKQTRKLFEYLKTFKKGAYVKYYALACFAGLRPNSEIERLAVEPKVGTIIDLEHSEISLPASITPKSSGSRTVTIQPNLAAFLKAYPGPILRGKNLRRDIGTIMRENNLSQDICRHSWYTYFIGLTDSISRAAMEGGSSERVVKEHYEAQVKRRKAQAAEYWAILP